MDIVFILGLLSFVVGIVVSYLFFARLRKSVIYDHYSRMDYMLVKRVLTFLFFVGTVYEFISSIYLVQCSFEIEMVFEEPKNFFALGLFVGSLLVKNPRR